MSKTSAKRIGVLCLIRDAERYWDAEVGDFPGLYAAGADDYTLGLYGLTLWDNGSFTTAENAGLITGWKSTGFIKLTDAGRKLLAAQEKPQ